MYDYIYFSGPNFDTLDFIKSLCNFCLQLTGRKVKFCMGLKLYVNVHEFHKT